MASNFGNRQIRQEIRQKEAGGQIIQQNKALELIILKKCQGLPIFVNLQPRVMREVKCPQQKVFEILLDDWISFKIFQI